MADSTGVQVFVGPANQLELGTVTTGPPAAELVTVTDRLQRLNLSIPNPSQELIDAQTASAAAATASASAATTAKENATSAANAAAASATSAAAAQTVAQTAQTTASTASLDAQAAAGSAATAADAAVASQAAAEAAQASAASMVPTDADLDAAVLRVITPATILIDTDGRPYFA